MEDDDDEEEEEEQKAGGDASSDLYSVPAVQQGRPGARVGAVWPHKEDTVDAYSQCASTGHNLDIMLGYMHVEWEDASSSIVDGAAAAAVMELSPLRVPAQRLVVR